MKREDVEGAGRRLPGFASNTERLLYLAETTREAAAYRRSYSISADLMALVYEIAAGKEGAVEQLRDGRI